MPIRISDELPAVQFLRKEKIFIMTYSHSNMYEIRPLRILLLNLMPKKIDTETQILRLLSNSSLQIDIQLLRVDKRESRHTSMHHLNSFYCTFEDIQYQQFDGMIVTGAPLGLLDFNNIAYWQQIKYIIEWAKEHITSTLFICWAVQAALNIFYKLPKETRKNKLFGVYEHHLVHSSYTPLTRGFDDNFLVPHSRYAEFPSHRIFNSTDLELLAESEITGAYLIASRDKRLVFVTGHPEYDAMTLKNEYYRDNIAGLKTSIPVNYFPNDDPQLTPYVTWRSHGNMLFSNWLNYYVYQITPYDLDEVHL
ncbi:homoserine O-acetyltransferase MetA [Candidatus Ishikawella capsulata]|nr:homoserine O-succinyltransferase [Candidatus Ishikawaella capsulata]